MRMAADLSPPGGAASEAVSVSDHNCQCAPRCVEGPQHLPAEDKRVSVSTRLRASLESRLKSRNEHARRHHLLPGRPPHPIRPRKHPADESSAGYRGWCDWLSWLTIALVPVFLARNL